MLNKTPVFTCGLLVTIQTDDIISAELYTMPVLRLT